MATPGEEIDAFLDKSEVPQARRSCLAVAFAGSMLDELRSKVAEWETHVAALRRRPQRAVTKVRGDERSNEQ